MRCVGCGTEMILVSVVPDETMIVAGFERYTMQCLDCGEVEQRFAFKSESGRTAETAAEAAAAVAEQARPPVPMASAWLRAVERLRGRQTAVTQRRAANAKADRVTQFYRDWEELIAAGPRPARLKAPPKLKSPRAIKAAAVAPAAGTGGAREPSSWERAVAKLRARQDRG
jgi:hypothetical protein